MLDVLLIDDDRLVLDSLAMLLEAEGFAVTAAGGGREALARGEEQLFDLVVCDIRMPDLDGLEVVGRLQHSQLDAQFILMTGYASEDAPIQALRLGIDDYLRKPFDLDAFLERIRTLCRQRRHRPLASPVLWRFSEKLRSLDPERDARVERLERRCEALAQERGLPLAELRLAAQFYDLPCQARATEEEGDLLARVASLISQPLWQEAPEPPPAPAPGPHPLAVVSLGKLDVARHGRLIQPRDWESSRARWLFVYLLCQRGRRVPQERLQELFWPEAEPEKSRRALVSTVHRVRKALGAQDVILHKDRSYEFNRQTECWWDLEEMEKALEGGEHDRALELYQGEFIPECPEEWAEALRERAHRLAAQAHEARMARAGDPGACEQAARRALAHENTSEVAWASLIRALKQQGKHDEAARTYQACVRVLEQELDLRPGPEVERAYHS